MDPDREALSALLAAAAALRHSPHDHLRMLGVRVDALVRSMLDSVVTTDPRSADAVSP